MLHRSAHPGYGVDDRNPSVLVPMPGQHMPTAGDWRIKRNRVVKDGNGEIMRGPKGGIRRVAKPADGEVVTDRYRIRSVKRIGDHTMLDTGAPNPLALGHNVFEQDIRESLGRITEPERKRESMAESLARAYHLGMIDLDDLKSTNPKLYRAVVRKLS